MKVFFFSKQKLGQLLFFCNGLGPAVLVPQLRKKTPHVTLLQGYVKKCIFMHSVVSAPYGHLARGGSLDDGNDFRLFFFFCCMFVVFSSTSFFVIARIFYFPLPVRPNIRGLMPVAHNGYFWESVIHFNLQKDQNNAQSSHKT